MARLTIEMSDRDHMAIKMLAASEGLSIKEWVFKRINKKALDKVKVPNRTTRKVLRDTELGKNLTHHQNFESMLKHLKYNEI